MPFVDVKEVTYSYEGGSPGAGPALRGITLGVERSEYLAIVGANASGKTTLALHLNGLLLPTSGSVAVDGLDTRRARDLPAIRQRVAMVFQKPEDQIVGATVEEDTAFGPENLKASKEEIRARVDRALAQVGLTGLGLRSPHELSAGQKQRLAIAGALALRPEAIVLDEPTSMLDPRGRRELLALLSELNGSGTTIIHITHRMNEAARASRIVILAAGRVAADGTPSGFSRASTLQPLAFTARAPSSWPPAFPGRREERWASRSTIPPSRALSFPRLTASPPHPITASSANAALSPLGTAASAAKAPLIRLVEVSHAYRTPMGPAKEIPSLCSVTLEVRRGEAIALIGPTGSGKSTLLQHLNCLFLPQAGRIELDGKAVIPAGADLPAIRRRIGLVFQRPEEQLFAQYVGDEVAYGPRLAGLSGKALTERVRWAMEAVGLPFSAYRDRLTFALSGGEQRKVGLAGVLALRPEALVLDEPTAGLDPASREELLALLERLKEEGTTIILSTHDLEEAGRVADRVVALVDGKIRLDLPTREAFDRAGELEGWSLELPPFVGMIGRLAQAGRVGSGAPLTLAEVEERLAAAFDRQEGTGGSPAAAGTDGTAPARAQGAAASAGTRAATSAGAKGADRGTV